MADELNNEFQGEITKETLPAACRLAENGDSLMQYRVGMYYKNTGDANDIAEAERYLTKAADAGNEDAVLELAKLKISKEQYDNARELLRRLIESSNRPDALWIMANCITNGYFSYNNRTAEDLYIESTAQGGATYMLQLAKNYYTGCGVPMHRGKTYMWLQRAEQAGMPNGKNDFADATGCDREALEWLPEACLMAEGGDVEQQIKAADYFISTGSVNEAEDYYNRAMENGSPDAALKLGKIYNSQNNFVIAAECFENAADCGAAEAYEILGVYYARGCGVIQDSGKSEDYFAKAIEAGDAELMLRMAFRYQYGKDVQRMPGRAMALIEDASKKGMPDAQERFDNMCAEEEARIAAERQAAEDARSAEEQQAAEKARAEQEKKEQEERECLRAEARANAAANAEKRQKKRSRSYAIVVGVAALVVILVIVKIISAIAGSGSSKSDDDSKRSGFSVASVSDEADRDVAEVEVNAVPTTLSVSPIVQNTYSIPAIDDNIVTAENAEILTYNASIDAAGECDDYAFTAPRDGKYRFEVSEMMSGMSVNLYVLNSLGEEVSSSKNSTNGNGISLSNLTEGAEYTVRVSQKTSTGSYTLTIGQQKPKIDVSDVTQVNDSHEFTAQENVYSFTAPRDGRYRFELSNMQSGNMVYFYIYNDLMEAVDSTKTAGNGTGLTVNLTAGETYRIEVSQREDMGSYTLSVGCQKETVDITEYTSISDSIQFTDQRNVYNFVAPRDGRYYFELSELYSGMAVKFYIYNALGEEVESISNAGNGNSICLSGVEAGTEYMIRISNNSGFGTYELLIGTPKETVDISKIDELTDSIEYNYQRNVYTFTAPESGSYSFIISEMSGNSTVNLYADNYLGETIAKATDCSNGHGMTLSNVSEGNTYDIILTHDSGLTNRFAAQAPSNLRIRW